MISILITIYTDHDHIYQVAIDRSGFGVAEVTNELTVMTDIPLFFYR